MATIACEKFTSLWPRRSEHLDNEILRDITPTDSLIGSVETGQFRAEDGVSHTFNKFNRVFPDLSTAWSDVTVDSCIGTPCDPEEVKIGMGSTKDSYSLKTISYATELYCFDKIMSADFAKETAANMISNLTDATIIINSNRIINEYFRIASNKWVATTNGLLPFTFTETGDLINVTVSQMPTAALTANHLRNRVQYQLLSGATGKSVKGRPPVIEVLTDMDTIWDLEQGDQAKFANWRYTDFDLASKEYYEYGWTGRMGNFMLKATLFPMRFNFVPGTSVLKRVFPYTNIQATLGIKGQVNDAYINAPVQATFIWHMRAMMIRMANSISINSRMPFAARDFAGKWQFVMDNLTCGRDVNGNPIAVNNSRRNKGMFISDFKYATQAQFPEYAEVILHLRAQACISSAVPCGINYAYPTQSYSSANPPCA